MGRAGGAEQPSIGGEGDDAAEDDEIKERGPGSERDGARLECRLYPVENASPGGVTKDDLLEFSVLFELGSDQAYLVDSDTSVGATTTRIPDAAVLKIPEDPGSLTIRSDGMATWVRLYPVEDTVRSMEFTGRCTKP